MNGSTEYSTVARQVVPFGDSELVVLETQCRRFPTVIGVFEGPGRFFNAAIIAEAFHLLQFCDAAVCHLEKSIVFYEDEENSEAASAVNELVKDIREILLRVKQQEVA